MIIIKLLGRKIAFNALLNRVTMLWRTKCSFQLIDFENDYYLARFNDEEDYNKVLTNRPWVIFGQYLTVRHWSPDFSTTQVEMGIQVVWRVEYESLSNVYFRCGLYGHRIDLCPKEQPFSPIIDGIAFC
ncbi:hypothetical protein GOBAR_DD20256 [Gossypium barbadense]|nr:hypothetical protein GOBAR_DD20256 [Gossypium barbadense]